MSSMPGGLWGYSRWRVDKLLIRPLHLDRTSVLRRHSLFRISRRHIFTDETEVNPLRKYLIRMGLLATGAGFCGLSYSLYVDKFAPKVEVKVDKEIRPIFTVMTSWYSYILNLEKLYRQKSSSTLSTRATGYGVFITKRKGEVCAARHFVNFTTDILGQYTWSWYFYHAYPSPLHCTRVI